VGNSIAERFLLQIAVALYCAIAVALVSPVAEARRLFRRGR